MDDQIMRIMSQRRVKWTGIVLSAAVALSFFGCAGASRKQRVSEHETRIENMRREIDFLRQQNSQYQRELESLKKQIAEFQLSNREDKADLRAKFDEILQQMAAVQTQLEDTNARMTRMMGEGGLPVLRHQQSALALPADTSAARTTTVPVFAADPSRELYNTAYRDFIRGNYQLALGSFQEFVKQHPNSELVDNAQYWIGEIYYAQGRYQQAIQEFEKILKWYRNGDKVTSALLKIGYSYINIDEVEQGRTYLDEIIKEYPKSDEANLARGRLAALE